jgi:hypothetical protein
VILSRSEVALKWRIGENENTFFSSLRGTLDRGRCGSGLLTCITSDDVPCRDLPLKRLREPAPGPNPASHRASTGLARPRCSSKSLPILARNLAAACPASGTSNPDRTSPAHSARRGRHAHGKLKPCPSRNSEGSRFLGAVFPFRLVSITARLRCLRVSTGFGLPGWPLKTSLITCFMLAAELFQS